VVLAMEIWMKPIPAKTWELVKVNVGAVEGNSVTMLSETSMEPSTPQPSLASVSVIFPAYQEELYLPAAVHDVVEGLRAAGRTFEVIVVENGSRDKTREVADGLAETYHEVRSMSSAEPDYGKALRTGLLAAQYDFVVNFDVDLYDLVFADQAIAKAQAQDLSVVVGSKRGEGSDDTRPLPRKVVTATFTAILRHGFGLQVSDTHGMKVMRRADVVDFARQCKFGTDLFDTELILRVEGAGLHTGEIGVKIEEKRAARTPIARRIVRSLQGLVRLKMALRHEARQASR
jgi:glycosyltransferase involved in cell wall biosynthesis